MKAKEYAKKYDKAQDKAICAYNIIRDMLLETEQIVKARHIKNTQMSAMTTKIAINISIHIFIHPVLLI